MECIEKYIKQIAQLKTIEEVEAYRKEYAPFDDGYLEHAIWSACINRKEEIEKER